MKYIHLADRCNWTIPAWEWQRLDLEDEEAGLWIERLATIGLLRLRKQNLDGIQAQIEHSLNNG